MSPKWRYGWGIPVILVIFLIWSMTTVSAEPVPNMTGSWKELSVERYSPSEGFSNLTGKPFSYQIVAQDGQAVAGEETYFDPVTVANITHFFPVVVSPQSKTFFKDEIDSGISFGEIVSDHELYNYMLFTGSDLMVIVSQMVKEGTVSAPAKPVPNLVGKWNLIQSDRNGVSTNGLLTITDQQGRIWNGNQQISDQDGTMIEEPIVGTIGDTERMYGITRGGSFLFGSMTRDATIESVVLIPGDTDGTFVVEQWITRNTPSIPESDTSYPDITGDWKIDNRKIIQNGTITDEGPVSGEWMSYTNQTGRFVTAIRHSTDTKGPAEIQSSVIFQSPDEAYLTNANGTLVWYHIIDDSTIEAVVNQKDGKAILYLDVLKRKTQ